MSTEDEFPVGSAGEDGPSRESDHEAWLSDSGSFVVELVDFVAGETDTEPTDLPPLSDAIDPEAVQRFLEADDSGRAAVRFQYAGCEVVVTGAGGMFLQA